MRTAKRTDQVVRAMTVACLLATATAVGGTQMQTGSSSTSSAPLSRPTPGNLSNSISADMDTPSPFQDISRQKRNDERQRRLVSDTQRLLYLANQLKSEVALSGAAPMTPEMLRQMDEIEKLARSVKDKMRD